MNNSEKTTVEITPRQQEALDCLGRDFSAMGERVLSESKVSCALQAWRRNQNPNDLKMPIDYPCKLQLDVGETAVNFACEPCQNPDMPALAAEQLSEQVQGLDRKVQQTRLTY